MKQTKSIIGTTDSVSITIQKGYTRVGGQSCSQKDNIQLYWYIFWHGHPPLQNPVFWNGYLLPFHLDVCLIFGLNHKKRCVVFCIIIPMALLSSKLLFSLYLPCNKSQTGV